MGSPVRVAWCPLLFARYGGAFTKSGVPIFAGEKLDLDQRDGPSDGMPIRGKCDRGYDCGHCYVLHEWLESLVKDGWWFGWECDACLRRSEWSDKETMIRSLPGIYQSGVQYEDDDRYEPPLDGCTNCGWQSSFLQLVLRRPK